MQLTPSEIYARLSMRTGEAQPEPRLSATRLALGEVSDPHRQFPFIHVTGTNGKPCTSRLAESMLRAHGRHTGLFTSPHLVDFTKRIWLDGDAIDAVDLSVARADVDCAVAVAEAGRVVVVTGSTTVVGELMKQNDARLANHERRQPGRNRT